MGPVAWKCVARLVLLFVVATTLASCRVYESEDDQYQYEHGGMPVGRYHEWDLDGGTNGSGP